MERPRHQPVLGLTLHVMTVELWDTAMAVLSGIESECVVDALVIHIASDVQADHDTLAAQMHQLPNLVRPTLLIDLVRKGQLRTLRFIVPAHDYELAESTLFTLFSEVRRARALEIVQE